MKWCFAVLSIVVANAAWAAIPPKAEAAYIAGDFVGAAAIAEKEASAEALAFAARARIADAITRDGPYCKPCLASAETIARAATLRDPNLAEGYVQLAIALGFRGRLIPLMEAKSERLAEKGEEAIAAALSLAPRNAWALAARGAWNLEIVHRAGPVLAGVTYGADRRQGLKDFREALTIEPANLLLHYHFALTLLALDADDYHAEAQAALEAGLKDTKADVLNAFTRKRAFELMELLKTGRTEQIDALVRRFQGYPPER
jgi:tetratricopeptide (TPR) repeat protein